MSDKIEHEQRMTRSEFADYLRSVADEFDREGQANVAVGNKSVTLRPPAAFKSEVEIVERSSVLRGDRESIQLEARWKASEGGE